MTNKNNENVTDLTFEVVYKDGQLGGIHVVGKYTDVKVADNVAGKTAEMDNAETVLIYVKNSNGEVIGTLTKKSGHVPHADI